MRQSRPPVGTHAAAGGEVRNCCRPLPLKAQRRPAIRLNAANAEAEASDSRSGHDRRPASTDSEAASFSGRVALPQRHSKHHHGSADHPSTPSARQRSTDGSTTANSEADVSASGAAASAWRATLAAAASACVMHGSLLWPSLDRPVRPELLLVAALQGPAALAADQPHGAAAKMRAVRQLATPDVQAMREVSEELAARPIPAGATAAAAGASSSSSSSGGSTESDTKARLKAADLASLLHIPAAQAKTIMGAERELGRLTRGSATQAFDAARELLGLGGDSWRQRELAGRLLARQPRVLLVSEPELRGRFAELQSLLAAPAPLVRKLVSSQPGLLTHPPANLRSRLSALCPLFNVDPSLASQLAAHEPGLLTVNAEELAARGAALAGELRLSRQQVVAVLRRHPQALLVPSLEMRSRLRALAVLLEVPRREAVGTLVLNAPRLVLLTEQEVAQHLAALQELLKLPRERVVVVASEQPALLTTPRAVLEERMRTLAELGKVPLAQARGLVAQKPALLTKSSAAMRQAVAEAEAAEAAQGQADQRAGGRR